MQIQIQVIYYSDQPSTHTVISAVIEHAGPPTRLISHCVQGTSIMCTTMCITYRGFPIQKNYGSGQNRDVVIIEMWSK